LHTLSPQEESFGPLDRHPVVIVLLSTHVVQLDLKLLDLEDDRSPPALPKPKFDLLVLVELKSRKASAICMV
jgi:hypothetical protein